MLLKSEIDGISSYLIEYFNEAVIIVGSEGNILFYNTKSSQIIPDISKDIKVSSILPADMISVEKEGSIKSGVVNVSDQLLFYKTERIDNLSFKGYFIFFSHVDFSNNQYKNLFNSVQEGIFVIDDLGSIVEANPAASDVYELSKGKLESCKIFDLFPHKTLQESEAIWEHLKKIGSFSDLYKYITADGKEKYIRFKANMNFQPGLHLGVFYDVTEHILTEKALKQSEANLKAVFNNNPQAILLLDLDFRIITLNKKALNDSELHHGKPIKEGDSLLEHMPQDKFEENLKYIELVKSGQQLKIELNVDWLNPELWQMIDLIPVLDHQGKVKSICATFTDISISKKAELNLIESEARFRSLVQNSSDIILILSPELLINYVSSSIANILGYEDKELSDRSFTDFIKTPDRDFLRIFDNVKSKNLKYDEVEFYFLHKKGYYVCLSATLNNQIDNDYVKGIVVNARDITVKKAQEDHLLLLERAIDSSKNGIVITDPSREDNPTIYVNKAFEEMTGFEHNDVVGQNCWFFQGEETDLAELNKVNKAFEEQKEVCVVIKNFRKDGNTFWNEVTISPVFNKEGILTNYIGVMYDITERKIQEEALLKVTQGVAENDEEDFFQNLAKYLSITLSNDVVFIGEYDGEDIVTKAFYHDHTFSHRLRFSKKKSPCYWEGNLSSYTYYEDIMARFPDFELGSKYNINYFLGIPLLNSLGKVIGLMAIMNKEPFLNKQLSENLLKIFSVRVSAKITRDYYIDALRSSEEKFRKLAENSPDYILMADFEEHKILYTNKDNFLGHSFSTIEGMQQWFNVIHPEDQEIVKEQWVWFITTEHLTKTTFENRYLNSQNQIEWIRSRVVKLENIEGKSKVALITITIDTERKNAEESLRESEAKLLSLVENTSDLIWSIDKEFTFTSMNSAFKNLFGLNYKKELQVGDNMKEILPMRLKDEWLELHNKALRGQKFSSEFISYSAQNPQSYEISFNPIYDNSGQVRGISVFGRDITQRKIAESAIIRTNFELDSFVYRASHDLRAPLRSILGLVNLIKVEEELSQREYYLSLVDKSIYKLDNFISDLTNFSRNTRLQLSSEKIDFRKIIDESIDNLKFMENAENFEIDLTINDNYSFYSDPVRISIVLHNLISNAIKYQNRNDIKSYCHIHVSTSKSNVEIVVSDNGIGIREQYLNKIFDMFFRASQESYGSGLGLYITKQVVEKLNGDISVQSQPGVGTSFIINLPNLKK